MQLPAMSSIDVADGCAKGVILASHTNFDELRSSMVRHDTRQIPPLGSSRDGWQASEWASRSVSHAHGGRDSGHLESVGTAVADRLSHSFLLPMHGENETP